MRIKKYLKQTMLRWRRTGAGSSGQVTYAPPVEMACRWEDIMEMTLTPDGRVVQSNAHVMLSSPVAPSDLIFLGTLADWRAMPTYPRPPTKLQGGYEVFRAGHTPDIRGRNLLYEAWA